MPKKQSNSDKNTANSNQDEIIEDLFTQTDDQLYRGESTSRAIMASVVSSVIFGMLAGVVGVFLILSGSLTMVPFFSSFSLETLLPDRQVIIRPQQAVTIAQDQQIRDVAMRVRGSVITFAKSGDTEVDDEEESVPGTEYVYTGESVLGFGVVLSSDGWLVTLNEVLGKRSLEDVVAISNSGKVYSITGRIVDDATGVAFVKVDADGLRATPFATDSYITSGEQLIAIMSGLPMLQSVVDRVVVSSLEETPIVSSSEELNREIIISNVDQRIVAPVFNFAGEVVGFQHGIYADGSSQQAYLRPVYHFASQINQVLSIQDIIRPVLGITWINLYGNPGLSDDIRQGFNKGVYVASVSDSGSASEAGIEVGDILRSVNDIEINGTFNFSEIIQQFGPSDKVVIKGVRDGEDKEFEVVLDIVQTTEK